MATWRIWFWSIFAIIVMAFIALCAALWSNISSEWQVEAAAARVALDDSPLNHIEAHDVFTGADVQEVFSGTDTFGRSWYAFVYGSPLTVHAVLQSDVMPQNQFMKRLTTAHIHPEEIHLGYLDSDQQTRLHTNAEVVYEVTGTDSKGSEVYQYFDAKTGKALTS